MFIPIIIVDESVINSMNYNCFSTCDPSSPSNNIAETYSDVAIGNSNGCCYFTSTSVGYGTDTTICSKCKLYLFTIIIVHTYK